MIKNNRQYQFAKKRLHEFEKELKTIRKKYSRDKGKAALLGQGYRKHVAQLKTEIKEYKKMKKSPLAKVLQASDAVEISHQLVKLRLARGFTQAELAARMGCKQADISRLEREEYQGYTINQLRKIATSLNAKIRLDLIPL